MGGNEVDSVRRLTLALLLASVAALGASVDDVPAGAERTAHSPAASLMVRPAHVVARNAYDERRCTERDVGGTPAALVELVRP
jgi:hypothetical protein